jgi:hypothetical protein
MAIPVSGPLSISQFNTELGRTSTEANSQLAGASTPQVGSLVYIAGQLGALNQVAPFSFSDWYGYTQGGTSTTTTTTTLVPPATSTTTTTTTLAPTTTTTTTTTTTLAPTTTSTTTTTTSIAGQIVYIGFTTSTGSSITLPSGLQQNDVVIICTMSPTTTVTLPNTGWTSGQTGSSNTVRYRWSYKRMGVTPDTTATNLSGTSVTIAFAFRGVNTTTLLDVTPPAIATSDRDFANPPSITTSTNNAMVVAVAFQRENISLPAPTNFTLVTSQSITNGTVAAAFRRKSPAGAENPAGFGGTADSEWVAATFALRD